MMERKKWTASTDITDEILKFREKRKWQVALRRYVIEKNISAAYAMFFGLSIENFRQWVELQFTGGLNWENFGSAWQFDHIVPVGYFNFANKEDLVLCWSFINISVEKIDIHKKERNRINLIAVKPYFESLYEKTGYSLCFKMVEKIRKIEKSGNVSVHLRENFIIKQKTQLEILSTLSKDEFNSLNMGTTLEDIMLEREIIKKFG